GSGALRHTIGVNRQEPLRTPSASQRSPSGHVTPFRIAAPPGNPTPFVWISTRQSVFFDSPPARVAADARCGSVQTIAAPTSAILRMTVESSSRAIALHLPSGGAFPRVTTGRAGHSET